MRRSKKGDAGFVMVLTLFMIVVLTFIGMAAILISGLDIQMAGNVRSQAGCFRAADGGVQRVMASVAGGVGLPGKPYSGISEVLGDYTFLTGHYDQTIPSNVNPVSGTAGSGVSDYKNLAGWRHGNELGFLFGATYATVVVARGPAASCEQEMEIGFSVGTN